MTNFSISRTSISRTWRPVKDRLRSFWRRAKDVGACRLGATAVEFGIVAPLFLAMTLGMVEMGRAMWIKASLQYACEETARYYMVNNGATTTTLKAQAQTYLADTGVTIATNPFTSTIDTSTTPDTMTITATYTFTGLVLPIPFPDVTLNAKSVVRANS
ncbi:MAG: TadE/TadG family type IV pilus assembly protein [Rhodospirillales bacterium]